MTPLPRAFYQRHPAVVAPDLLSKILVRQVDGITISGRIVETEAYCSEDPASHTFRGMTERNKAMFGEVGRAYIYFIHGLHYCMNATARLDTAAGGVLIRALEPLAGVEQMQRARGRSELRDLATGPAKLAQALSIDKSLYGADLTLEGPLFIAAPDIESIDPAGSIVIEATPRIGISLAKEVPWRFILKGNRYLSR